MESLRYGEQNRGKMEFGDVSGASGVCWKCVDDGGPRTREGMLESPTGKEAPST